MLEIKNNSELIGDNLYKTKGDVRMGREKSYADSINSAKVMLAGLKLNTERVGKRGISADFIAELETAQKSAQDLDNEQEDLKAKLKTKTAELGVKMENLDKMMSEAKKAVKLEMEKEAWKSFGIQDAR
jgi:hypothetical protein